MPIAKTPIKQTTVDTKISSQVKPIVTTFIKKTEIDKKISSPVKLIAKTPIKQTRVDTKITSPVKAKLTKTDLSAKTINELKDICRDKSLSGFSSQKTKSVLIDWMLTQL